MKLPTSAGSVFTVLVKTRAPQTTLLRYDAAREAYIIAVAAVPDKGKANKALLRYLAEEGITCDIISGATSRKKLLRVE